MKYQIQLVGVLGKVVDESNEALTAESAIGLIRAWEATLRPTPAQADRGTADVENALAAVYRVNTAAAAAVGQVCDEKLDKSGAMLGRIRELARNAPAA